MATLSLDDRLREAGIRSRLIIPLISNDEIIGCLNFGSRQPDAYSPDDVQVLAPLAEQMAIALEDARLHARVEQLAVVEEWERISRELHDGLGQAVDDSFMWLQVQLVGVMFSLIALFTSATGPHGDGARLWIALQQTVLEVLEGPYAGDIVKLKAAVDGVDRFVAHYLYPLVKVGNATFHHEQARAKHAHRRAGRTSGVS